MIRQAREIGMDRAQHLGDWEILARLRHNGAATRLIDVTTDPFVALFMLCDPVATGDAVAQDGVLLSLQRDKLKAIDEPWASGSYDRMLKKESRAALSYKTSPIDSRISAQRGEFVLSTKPWPASSSPECELFRVSRPQGWSAAALEKTMRRDSMFNQPGQPRTKFPNIMGILVPAEVKPMILKMLSDHFGFTRETIYPDWAGLAVSFDGKQSN